MSKDRLDWPELSATGYSSLVRSIDKHPKPLSIRQRESFNVSHIRYGIALPCCYLARDRNARLVQLVTGFGWNGAVYYASFANVLGTQPPATSFLYWRAAERALGIGSTTIELVSDLFFWNYDEARWFQSTIRFPVGPNLPQFDGNLQFSADGIFLPFGTMQAGIQCKPIPDDFERVDLPGTPLRGFPWPPIVDDWWTDGIAATSGRAI